MRSVDNRRAFITGVGGFIGGCVLGACFNPNRPLTKHEQIKKDIEESVDAKFYDLLAAALCDGSRKDYYFYGSDETKDDCLELVMHAENRREYGQSVSICTRWGGEYMNYDLSEARVAFYKRLHYWIDKEDLSPDRIYPISNAKVRVGLEATLQHRIYKPNAEESCWNF